MRSSSYSAIRIYTLFIICVTLFGSCATAQTEIYIPPVSLSVDWNEQARETMVVLPLFFYDKDGKREIEYREVMLKNGQTRAELGVRALFEPDENSDSSTPFTPLANGVRPTRVQVSGNTAIVDLEGNEDKATLIKSRVAIANTLIDLLDINYVNIFYNGKAMEYDGWVLGAMTRFEGSPSDYLSSVRQISSASSYPTTINVTLYFPDKSGKLLVCETRPVEINGPSNEAQEAVMNELLQGQTSNALQEVVSNSKNFLIASKVIRDEVDEFAQENESENDEDEDQDQQDSRGGMLKNKLQVLLSGSATSDISRDAIVATLMTLPEIDGVGVSFDLSGFDDSEIEYFMRFEASRNLGRIVELRQIDAQRGALEKVEVVLPQEKSEDIFAVTYAQIELTALCDPSSLKEAYACGDTAVVNFSSDHSDVWKQWNVETKRLFIYSIVNTLSNVPGINRVQFLEDGGLMTSMEPISLGSPLLFNKPIEY